MISKIADIVIATIACLAGRLGWRRVRREDGHPISLVRTFFGKYPRFGAYEYDEPGCSDECKRSYEAVIEARLV